MEAISIHIRMYVHMRVCMYVCYVCMYINTFNRLINGAEYLFTAKDESDCTSWINHINAAIHHRQC